MILQKYILNNNIKVLVESLPKGSNYTVLCKCDKCEKEYFQRFCRNTDTCSECRKHLPHKKFVKSKGLKYEIPSKDELESILTKGKCFASKHYECTIPVINSWIKKYDLEIEKYRGLKTQIPEDFYEYFINQNPSLVEIKNRYNISRPTIIRWIKDCNLEFKGKTTKKEIPLKAKLIELNQYMNTVELSNFFSVSEAVLRKWFIYYNISLKKYNSGISNAEIELRDYLNSFGFNFSSRKSVLDNGYLELDCYDSVLNIAFEYCGIFWHSNAITLNNKQHLEKYSLCKNKGIKLYTIFENEWLYKKNIIKSIIKAKLNKIDNKIYGRNCIIKEVGYNDAKKFHEENHLNGFHISKYHIGLYFGEKLISLMSFGKSRNRNYEYELIRFSTKLETLVVGGAKKILNYFENKYKPTTLISYCDLRFSDGNVYNKLGFDLLRQSPPNYFYFHKNDYSKLFSRNMFQKHKLKNILKKYDENLTEEENMKNNNYYKIYDCGNLVFIKKYSQ